MSAGPSFWAWAQPARGNAKLVLLALGDSADDDGICWPAKKSLAAKCGISSKSVQRALHVLEEDGLLEHDQRHRNDGSQTSHRYRLRLNCPPPWSDCPPTPGQSVPPGGSDCPPMNLLKEPTQKEPTQAINQSAPDEAEVDVPVERRLGEDGQPVPLLSPGGEIDAVWEHYVEARRHSPMAIRKTTLDPEQRRNIKTALKIATLDEIKRAIDGLFVSPWHLGQNPDGKLWLSLDYVCKGHSGKTTRGQIDNLIQIAEKHGPGPSVSSVDPGRLAEAKRNVLTAWEMPRSGQAKELGDMSAAWLAQHGYRVEFDPDTGRPTFIEGASA